MPPASLRHSWTPRVVVIGMVFLVGMAAAAFIAYFVIGGRGDVFRIVGTVLGAVGNQLPAVSTRYGNIDLKTKRIEGGLQLTLICSDCRLRSDRLAPQTLRLDKATLEGFYKSRRFQGKVRVDSLSADIDTTWINHHATGTFILPKSSIPEIFSILSPIVPEVSNASITGEVSGKGKFSWPNIDLLFDAEISDFTVDGLVDAAKYRMGEFPLNIRDRDGNPDIVTSGEGSPDWTPLPVIGPWLPAAVIASEDGGFYSHPGYDIAGMLEAARKNRQAKEIRRGGSTITQQLAKNLFLDASRNYARKLRELLYTVELERELGKKRILEVYLNIVEWGPGVYGAYQAAKLYFGKVPSELLPEEAAWLASILNSPRRAHERQFLQNQPNLARVNITLRRMKGLSERQLSESLARPLRFIGKPLPTVTHGKGGAEEDEQENGDE